MKETKRGTTAPQRARRKPFRRGATQESLREDARNVRRRDEAEEDLARDAYSEEADLEDRAVAARGRNGGRNGNGHDDVEHDDLDREEGHPDDDRAPAPRRPMAPRIEPYSPVSEYTLLSFYDKSLGQYVVTVAEYPELKLQGADRNALLEELEQKLEDQFEIMRRRGEATPESISGRQYPERLDVPISSGLYRRLDMLSRLQRVSLEKLVTELLSSGIERRFSEGQRSSGGGGSERRPQQHSQRHHGGNHQGGGGGHHRGERHHTGGRQGGGGGGNRHGGGGQPRGRAYHDTMDNRENFLEYVRNLEKNKFRK